MLDRLFWELAVFFGKLYCFYSFNKPPVPEQFYAGLQVLDTLAALDDLHSLLQEFISELMYGDKTLDEAHERLYQSDQRRQSD
jgi:hypothetical protein